MEGHYDQSLDLKIRQYETKQPEENSSDCFFEKGNLTGASNMSCRGAITVFSNSSSSGNRNLFQKLVDRTTNSGIKSYGDNRSWEKPPL